MIFALKAGTNPGTEIILPVSAVCSGGGWDVSFYETCGSGRTYVLREIRPGRDGACEVVYTSVSMLRVEGVRAGMAGWMDEWVVYRWG